MTARSIVLTARAAAAAGVAAVVTGTTISLVSGQIEDWWAGHIGVAALITVGLCVVVWLVIPRQPRNAAVWAMATAPLGGGMVLAFAIAPILAGTDADVLRYPNYVPAEHPPSVALLFTIGEVSSHVGVFVPLTFGLLLFPTGTLPSRRWRWAALWTAGSISAVAVLYAIALRPGFSGSPEAWAPLGSAQFGVLVAMMLAVLAVVARCRSSSGDVRQQCKWVLWGGAVAALSLAGGMALAGTTDVLSPLLVFTGFAVLVASYGVAIVRYRLYDVDLVISRTIVYAALAAIITGAYVGIVVGVGRLLGAGDAPDTALAIATTAAVAAAFQPLRRRLQKLVDRLVSGRRATPHEVLSEFARRVSANDDRLLELAARSLVDGTGADRVEIRLLTESRSTRVVAWPPHPDEVSTEVGTTLPIQYHGAQLGSLVLCAGVGQRLSEQDRNLAEQVASGMGLALRNRALTETLGQRVTELARSRRRLVAVQDETRRRLERDLHDGAQQQLVALRVKLGLARKVAQADGATRTDAALARLAEQADRVVDDMREFARGVYPPLLEAEGLATALAALTRRAPVPVTLRTDGIGRYERDVESTVNMCVTEALRNVATRPGTTRADVTLVQSDGVVRFEVSDDGDLFDSGIAGPGDGLRNLADRVDALSGSFEVHTTPGGGTRVAGSIPVDTTLAATASEDRREPLVASSRSAS
jgi:signal transduction histidine kinase